MKHSHSAAVRIVLVGASAAGLLVALEMHGAHARWLQGIGASGWLCADHGIWNCNDVAGHAVSWLFGVPLSIVAMARALGVLYLALAGSLYRGAPRRAAIALGTIVAGLALVLDAYQAVVMVGVIGAVCRTTLASIALGVLAFACFRSLDRADRGPVRWRSLLPSLAAAGRGTGERYESAFQFCLIAGLVSAAGRTVEVAVAPMRRVEGLREKWVGFASSVLLQATVPPSLLDPGKAVGPPDARLTLLLVGDYADRATRATAQELERLRTAWPEEVRVGYLHMPLDAECNPAFQGAAREDTDACWLAQAAEAAADQGRFPEFHRFVLDRTAHGRADPATVLAALEGLGIDRSRFVDAIAAPASLERVRREAARCVDAGVSVVPSVLINGHSSAGALPPLWIGSLPSIDFSLAPAAAQDIRPVLDLEPSGREDGNEDE